MSINCCDIKMQCQNRINVTLPDGKVIASFDARNYALQELVIALESNNNNVEAIEILLPMYRFVAGV